MDWILFGVFIALMFGGVPLGVAMGLAGSDIAANSAGVALMNDDLSRVPFLIELSRRTRSIISPPPAVHADCADSTSSLPRSRQHPSDNLRTSARKYR